ncbi:MAG: serine/threonine-protein kinase, partial [Rhodothermales bacterium]
MIGTTVSHYEIVEQLGGGGMGVVYTARDTKLDRLVALKFLPAELSRDADANARFMQEAKAASALDHPNICTIYEFGEADDGRLFIAMAHYEGQTLKYRLGEGSIDEGEAVGIARQIAEGLRAAHKKGIIHRDIKPANIMVTDDGLVKILDFGLAKLPGVLSLTQTGSTLGTAAYMSPEQIRGGKVDGRTDLWSLGVVLYQMLAGHRPFEGDYEQALTYAILNQEVEPLDQASSDLQGILAKLLTKDPEQRYASADALLEDLPEPSGPVDRAPKRASREPLVSNRVAMVAAVILVAAVIASTYFNFFSAPTQEATVDEMTIGVMPFTVRGQPSLDYLGGGMVDLLSVKLDGAGEIRAVDPNALLGVIAKENLKIVTPDDARNLANRLGAARMILGNVTQVGSEIQITASLYGTGADPEVDATVTADGESEIPMALDGLAKQLVAGLLTAPDQTEVSLAAVTTSSFPALKAYLAGLQLSRTGRYPEAAVELEKAVQIDSSFAMAWSALGWAYGWIPDPLKSDNAEKHALANSASLPWRARTLIEATNEGFRLGDGEKARNLYQSVLAKYPNDTEALRGLGEIIFHYNPLFGRPHSEADAYFERASALVPDNMDYLRHQYDSAVDEWDFDRADSIAAEILKLDDEEAEVEYAAHMHAIMMR